MRCHLPACACSPDKVKYLAGLYFRRSSLPSSIVQPIHDIFQNVERRKPSHAPAIFGSVSNGFR